MKEFLLTCPDDVCQISGYAHDHFESGGKPLKVQITQRNNGTIPMLKLWRMWMAEIARWKADRGSAMPLYYDHDGNPVGWRRFNENDAHEAYTYLCLGADENGNRYSWAVNSDEYEGRKVASIGQKLHAMQKFHQHCIEHGIPITIPDNSEYKQLQDKQDGQS